MPNDSNNLQVDAKSLKTHTGNEASVEPIFFVTGKGEIGAGDVVGTNAKRFTLLAPSSQSIYVGGVWRTSQL